MSVELKLDAQPVVEDDPSVSNQVPAKGKDNRLLEQLNDLVRGGTMRKQRCGSGFGMWLRLPSTYFRKKLLNLGRKSRF